MPACAGRRRARSGDRLAVARRVDEEEARVDRLERDQDLQPQVVGAAHVPALPLAVAFPREELGRLRPDRAQPLVALGVVERRDAGAAQGFDAGARGEVLPAARVLDHQLPQRLVRLPDFAKVAVGHAENLAADPCRKGRILVSRNSDKRNLRRAALSVSHGTKTTLGRNVRPHPAAVRSAARRPQNLAAFLGVEADELADWVEAKSGPPRAVFEKAMEVILAEHDRRAAHGARGRSAGAPTTRRNSGSGPVYCVATRSASIRIGP